MLREKRTFWRKLLSLPSWERGLKLLSSIVTVNIAVSLPSWERGLKSFYLLSCLECLNVAPLVGAWIEISLVNIMFFYTSVAPLVGAWIEICLTHKEKRSLVSLPSWERGLKYFVHLTLFCCSASLPSWERGLKFTIVTIVVRFSRRSPRGSVD